MSTTTLTVPSRSGKFTAWTLQIVLSFMFFAAAGAKLAGQPMMVQTFNAIGLGQEFRYVVAIIEIVGAGALLSSRTAALAGLWLGATMVGATIVHLAILHVSPAAPLILLALCLAVAWLRRAPLLVLIATR